MQSTRRNFLATSIGSLATMTTVAAAPRAPLRWAEGQRGGEAGEEADDPDTDRSGPLRPLDYGLSFICNPAAFNAVRFWVESRTVLTDEQTGQTMHFYQCGSCKSEHTFAKKDLFHEDNYDFLPILGGDDWLIFRRPAYLSERYREVRPVEKIWGKPLLKLREGRNAGVLDTWEKVRDATADAIPIVSQTEIAHPDTGLRAIIECPVKTMNVSLENQVYQVDTGPVALPDLTRRYDKPIESLSLAFLAFNAPGFADFVVEQPTPVIVDDREVGQVYHYSKPFSLPARNRLFAAQPSA
jgi:hypothetical protein